MSERYLRLDTGKVIALPVPFNPAEFELAGNSLAFACGVVVLFDPTTGTLATHTKGTWWMQQSATREQFERHCRNIVEIAAVGDEPPSPDAAALD